MIRSFRNFAKTKYAGLLVFIMIIPFVFWGMGSMFSSGNTNTIAKINKTNISTEDFIDHLNNSGIPQSTIRDNLKNNIIEELLSNLISTSLLNLEIENYNLIISQNTLLYRIKNNGSISTKKYKFNINEEVSEDKNPPLKDGDIVKVNTTSASKIAGGIKEITSPFTDILSSYYLLKIISD